MFAANVTSTGAFRLIRVVDWFPCNIFNLRPEVITKSVFLFGFDGYHGPFECFSLELSFGALHNGSSEYVGRD